MNAKKNKLEELITEKKNNLSFCFEKTVDREYTLFGFDKNNKYNIIEYNFIDESLIYTSYKEAVKYCNKLMKNESKK